MHRISVKTLSLTCCGVEEKAMSMLVFYYGICPCCPRCALSTNLCVVYSNCSKQNTVEPRSRSRMTTAITFSRQSLFTSEHYSVLRKSRTRSRSRPRV